MTNVNVENGDDGLRLRELVIFTKAWQIEYKENFGTPYFVLLEREDKVVIGPMAVRSAADLAILITESSPPYVTIRSAPNEDVTSLQGLVERATRAGRMH